MCKKFVEENYKNAVITFARRYTTHIHVALISLLCVRVCVCLHYHVNSATQQEIAAA